MGEKRTPRSIRRIAILASIFVMLAVTLIPTLRSTLNQRSEINDLRAQLEHKRDTVAALKKEQQHWTDPAYVEQQARDRLKFVRVGETSYTVIEPASAVGDAGAAKIAAPTQVTSANSPWYGQLWRSLVIADVPAKTSVKAPVGTRATTPTGSKTSTATSPAG